MNHFCFPHVKLLFKSLTRNLKVSGQFVKQVSKTFSTYAKYSEKLIFPTPRYAHARVRIGGRKP